MVVEGEDCRDRITVAEKVMVEEDNGGACDGGDVMVEILGHEVFVDGARDDLGGDFDSRIEDSGTRSSGEDSLAVCRDGLSGIQEDGLGSEDMTGHLIRKCTNGLGDRTEFGKNTSSHTAEVKSNDNEHEAQHSMSGIKLTVDKKNDVGAKECVDTLKEDEPVGGSSQVLESWLREQEKEGDEQNIRTVNGCYEGNDLRDRKVKGDMELVESPIMDDKRICMDCGQSSCAPSSIGPEKVVTMELLPGQVTDADVSSEPVLERPVVSDFVNRDSMIADNELSELSDMQTRDLADDSNGCILVLHPDAPSTGLKINESLYAVEGQQPIIVGITHGNNAVHDVTNDAMTLEIDAVSGSLIHLENQLVDEKEHVDSFENNVTFSSLLHIPTEETVIEMDIDADDSSSRKPVSIIANYDLKLNSRDQEPEKKADESCEPSDHAASALVDKQDVGAGITQNVTEKLKRDSASLGAQWWF